MLRGFEKAIVSCDSDLRDAMLALDQGAFEIVLVLDKSGRLVGTLTDGDVRRALLAGAQLASPLKPHMHREFTAVNPSAGRAAVLDLMQARRIAQIPVVTGDGRLVGLHLLHEMLGGRERPNWAVIMAGGKGTRLRPLTEHLPKPMIPVAGRPILERLVLHLVGYGFRRVFLAINYLGHMVEAHFGDGHRFGCQIEYLRETQPLGTGGALGLLSAKPTEPLLVMNGDVVTQVDLDSLFRLHAEGGYTATVGVRHYSHTVPFGCVEVEDGRIFRFEEKPVLSRTINTGIYALSPSLVERVPRDREFPLPQLIEDCLQRGDPVGAYAVEDDWIDVGHRDQLHLAREGAR